MSQKQTKGVIGILILRYTLQNNILHLVIFNLKNIPELSGYFIVCVFLHLLFYHLFSRIIIR